MKWLKGIILGIALLAVGAVALGLFYFLPQHDVVMVTGVEVKRVDHDGVINAENPADGPTRDVYFINTESPDTKNVMVYRNEDTGWSFPGTSSSTRQTSRPRPRVTPVIQSNWH